MDLSHSSTPGSDTRNLPIAATSGPSGVIDPIYQGQRAPEPSVTFLLEGSVNGSPVELLLP